jgi:pantoate--beta-alanine ligase
VATVVAKLFNILPADRAYFGEKDCQQLAVIEKMAADLNFPIAIAPVSTVRESDGLAMSSRNRRLTPEQRSVAPLLYQALVEAAGLLRGGTRSTAEAKKSALAILTRAPEIRVEYFEIVDATFHPLETIAGEARITAAVWLGGVRLIDNVRV